LGNTTPGGGGLEMMSFGGKNVKRVKKKGENIKEKGRKE
jgi:hypothetical protein